MYAVCVLAVLRGLAFLHGLAQKDRAVHATVCWEENKLEMGKCENWRRDSRHESTKSIDFFPLVISNPDQDSLARVHSIAYQAQQMNRMQHNLKEERPTVSL